MKLIFLVISVLFGTFAVRVCYATSDKPSMIQLSIDEKAIDGQRFLLTAGVLEAGKSVATSLYVINVTKEVLTIDLFKDGKGLDVRWKEPNARKQLTTRAVLDPGERREVVLKWLPATDARQALQFGLFSDGEYLASVAILSMVGPQTISDEVGSGGFASALGDGPQHYDLCTLRAPSGYTLDAASVRLTMHTVPGGHHERDCDHFVECSKARFIQGRTPLLDQVCYGFDIHGHHKGGNLATSVVENEVVNVDARLVYQYVISQPTLTLRSVASKTQ